MNAHRPRAACPRPASDKKTAQVNRFYAHADSGEPTVHLNNHDPADPFAAVYLGDDWYVTSKDPGWCRRVASAWTHAAELLESAAAHGRHRIDSPDHQHPAAREPIQACPP
jgi:hypothetical protein